MTKTARILASATAALVLSATVAGCDFLGLSGPSGPGELHANILSPDGAVDGAAVLELTGVSGIGPISTSRGRIFSESGGTTTRLVVILDDPGMLTFDLRVDDVAELPTATIVQIADGNNVLRSTVSEYEVEWVQLADDDRDFHRSGR